MFSRIDRILGRKTRVNVFKIVVIIQSMSSDHNGMKLESNNKKRWEINKYEEIKQK